MSSVQDMVVIYFIRTNERHTQNDEMENGKKTLTGMMMKRQNEKGTKIFEYTNIKLANDKLHTVEYMVTSDLITLKNICSLVFALDLP